MFKTAAFCDAPAGLAEIARCMTFACSNRRDIVRLLMGTCSAFAGMPFGAAMETYRSYERAGLVRMGDGYVAVYHDET